jgi:glucosamine--fructose-6-phosphate aminotransferase (isomerizing)
MCGIVGILAREPVADKIIASLRRLEYRGYDSAGLATLESGRLTLRRAQGKLTQLERRLSCEPLSGTIGIGHKYYVSSRAFRRAHSCRSKNVTAGVPTG